MTAVPRLRMFAGPNGSGKSTLKSILPPLLLGAYINPDEIEATLRKKGVLSLKKFGVECEVQEIVSFFENSTLLRSKGILGLENKVEFKEGRLRLKETQMNSYAAAVIADFIRYKLLSNKISFTFETVMSSKDKIEILRKAKGLGYRTYLY